ncbi:30S ribosomal protein S16 [Candidatus Latescibacterota bacterium]
MLRLRRMGSRKHPFYRIVAADSRFQRDGRFLEVLGYYDPKSKPFKFDVDREKTLNWLNKGAQTSGTVKSLLRREGILQEYNLSKIKGESSSEDAGKKEVEAVIEKPLDEKVDKAD